MNIQITKSTINNETVNSVNARDLYLNLEIKQQFADWIKSQIKRARLVENKDYISISFKSELGNKPLTDYIITIDASKNISMMSNTDRGFEVREYFIACEKELKANSPTVPQTYIEALTEVLRLAKDNEMLQLERDKAVKTNTILTHVKKVYTATEIAKELGLRSATKLNNTLKEMGVQYKTNNTWMFYAKHSDLGYESIKQTALDNGKVIYSRYFTQIGREFILRCVTDYLVTIA